MGRDTCEVQANSHVAPERINTANCFYVQIICLQRAQLLYDKSKLGVGLYG